MSQRLEQGKRPSFDDVAESRRRNMSAIRGKDTKPELTVRQALHHMGYRFRLHARNLPGHPDLTFPARRKVVFIHGCFWHRHQGCRNSVMPSMRHDFWRAKLEGNVARDARNRQLLKERRWSVIVVWECEIEADLRGVARSIAQFLGPPHSNCTRSC